VSFLEHPEYFTTFRKRQLRTTVSRTVKRAACILAPSEFSKRSILRAYQLEEEKVVVIPNAVSTAFRPIARELAQRRVRSLRGLPTPFVLTVSDIQPRKNHLTLIHAFEELLRAHPQLPHHLVIVGKDTWYTPLVKTAASKSKVSGRIHFTGFISDDELLQLYGACDMFIYPSLYEGFGLPILEAMASGRAVACSNTSAMPEVADSAALLFDPCSVPEIERAMADLLLHSELRARMERLGAHRATMFTWEKTASKTLDIYYDVADPAKTKRARRAAAVSMPQ
jgi:glycosyltransferase involved in cell wall biosynthesis